MTDVTAAELDIIISKTHRMSLFTSSEDGLSNLGTKLKKFKILMKVATP